MSKILTENNNDLLNYGEIDINKSKVLIENMDEKEKEKYEFLIQMLPQYQINRKDY